MLGVLALAACGPKEARPGPRTNKEPDPVAAVDAAVTPADPNAAMRTACDGGDLEQCRLLARAIQADDPAGAWTLFQRSCDGGNLRGCRGLVVALINGAGVAADPARAYTMSLDLCDRGDPGSCYNLGVMYRNGIGTGQDLVGAAARFEAVCLAGDGLGCFDNRDSRPAACEDHNYEYACAALAELHLQGVGGCAYDEDCAAALSEMACNGGLTSTCK